MTFHVATTLTGGRRVADNEIKIAVRLDEEVTDFVNAVDWHTKLAVNQLFEMRTDEPISCAILNACQRWGISATKDGHRLERTYAFRFESGHYVSEENRSALKNGNILYMTVSPEVKCKEYVSRLRAAGTEDDQSATLRCMAVAAADPLCADRLVGDGALALLAEMVRCEHCFGRAIPILLNAFSTLMQQVDASWRDTSLVDKLIVERLAAYVNGSAKSEDRDTLVAALAILEAIASHSDTSRRSDVRRLAGIESLIRHLSKSDVPVQHATVCLMNALLLRAGADERLSSARLLAATPARDALCLNVVAGCGATADGRRQLATMQRLMLHDLVHSRAMQPATEDDMIGLNRLRQLCFSAEALSPTSGGGGSLSARATRQFSALGFGSETAPWRDLAPTPPGALALDCLTHFAQNDAAFMKIIVLSNMSAPGDNLCPLAAVTVHLCAQLCHILGVDTPVQIDKGELVDVSAGDFNPILWTDALPMHHMYSVCIKHLYRMWSEMNATVADVDKVIAVVREQIDRCWPHSRGGQRSLAANKQHHVTSWKSFAEALSKLSYTDVLTMWQQERSIKDCIDLKSKPIIELEERLRPQMAALVLEHTMKQMRAGRAFPLYTMGERARKDPSGKWCFWRLSANGRALHYAECDEPSAHSGAQAQQHNESGRGEATRADCTAPPLRFDELKQRLSVCDIGEVLVGKEVLHAREPTRKTRGGLAFAFTVSDNEQMRFNLVAPDEDTLTTWTDGLYALCGGGGGGALRSERAAKQIETLLEIERSVRLLDLDGVQLPAETPPMPDEPPPPFD